MPLIRRSILFLSLILTVLIEIFIYLYGSVHGAYACQLPFCITNYGLKFVLISSAGIFIALYIIFSFLFRKGKKERHQELARRLEIKREKKAKKK